MTQRKIEKVSYGGWANCYRLTNGKVELIVTTDVGPRVIRYGFVGGQNYLSSSPVSSALQVRALMGRGGHRFWTAPEVVPDTYALDNESGDCIRYR